MAPRFKKLNHSLAELVSHHLPVQGGIISLIIYLDPVDVRLFSVIQFHFLSCFMSGATGIGLYCNNQDVNPKP